MPAAVAGRAFDEDRETLKRFVHDVYHGYLAFALSRNYLNFGFLQLFAFVLLSEDDALRDRLAFEYVMVDEFQDTSEIQFKLALLLCGTDNFCVVGDWKQSIYGFQYAAVENITEFEDRLARFVTALDGDRKRVRLEPGPVTTIELVENYRSTQSLIDFAEHGLVVPATNREPVDAVAVRDRIVPLNSNRERDDSRIEAVRHVDEAEAVLTVIQEIVGNCDYQVGEDGEHRAPGYGDIAVLTRTRDFGRALLHATEECGLPMAYEGGIELFRTNQAKLLLAWLRILESDADRGWTVVLERAGYTLDEMKELLEGCEYPAEMREFRAELDSLESLGAVAKLVFGRYGFDGAYADVVLDAVQSVHDATTMTRGDVIRFIERGIAQGSTREIHAGAGTDAVTVQTIHAAKGLEYPIVILANMNRHKFPRTGGGRGTIRYEDPIGLRQRRVYAEDHGRPHLYDNWRLDVLRRCLPKDYDEERRLLYVAMTRAEDHLVFTAGETPNTFLEELPVEVVGIEPDVREVEPSGTVQTALDVSVPMTDGPAGWSPHDLMDETVFSATPEGMGTEFGTRMHAFAEAYARGDDVEPAGNEADWTNVMAFVDSLEGELRVEQDAVLPLEVDGETVIVRGVVDLVCVSSDAVEVVDPKTDRNRRAEAEYRKQVSVYYHVLDAWYPDREVDVSLFFTAEGDRLPVEPLTVNQLRELVVEVRR